MQRHVEHIHAHTARKRRLIYVSAAVCHSHVRDGHTQGAYVYVRFDI
jgi:hypothetical protein